MNIDELVRRLTVGSTDAHPSALLYAVSPDVMIALRATMPTGRADHPDVTHNGMRVVLDTSLDAGTIVPVDEPQLGLALDVQEPPTPARKSWPVPPGAALQSCRSCNAPIFWIETDGGKRMPVDAESHESHFSTCPNAAQHRKPRGKKSR